MANTLTGLIPVIYNAMNVVSREMIGMIPAVARDTTAAGAAKGQTVRSPVVPAMAAKDIVPGNIAASGTDQTIDYVDIVITKSRAVPFHLTGEEELGLGQPNNTTVARDRFAQAFRTLANEMELDLASEYINASRAYGTGGTTPFNTGDDLTDLTEALRILDDNGAPTSDRHAVMGSAAIAKLLGKQGAVFKVNEAGSEDARRLGQLGMEFGASIHHSGQIQVHNKGTGTGYLVDGATAAGNTALTLKTGTGTVLQGDVLSIAGDSHKYVTATGLSAPGAMAIQKPGLRLAAADSAAVSLEDNYTANMVFSRDAIQLAARTPAIPSGGDQADDRTQVTDPMSGITFDIAVYRQYHQVTYEVGAAWGVKTVKPQHLALLLG